MGHIHIKHMVLELFTFTYLVGELLTGGLVGGLPVGTTLPCILTSVEPRWHLVFWLQLSLDYNLHWLVLPDSGLS